VKPLFFVAAALSLLGAPPAFAACTDAQGRLAKCPKPAGGKIVCRDERGKKAKCGLPGTHVVDK
jgi:hypothetical protein